MRAFAWILLKNPSNGLPPNSRVCAATLSIGTDSAIKARKKVTGRQGRGLAGCPSKFRRSLCLASRIVIDPKIGVFQHRVMGGSSSTQVDRIGLGSEEETVRWTILLASISQ